MDTGNFYGHLAEVADLPPDERYQKMSALHTSVFEGYMEAVEAITAEGAARVVPDGRTVKQVVGHIAEWERYVIISAGEMLAGVTWPGLMSHSRYVEPDGSEFPFRNDDEFNTRQAEKCASKPWAQTRELAIRTASACHRLWVRSGLLGPELLERTRLWQHYRLPTGVTLSVPCGWFLWMITVEHEGVEHVSDLELGRGA